MRGRWIAVLWCILLAGNVSAEDNLVINAGVGGNSTRNLLKRVDKDVLAHNPEVVVMMVGTNDALNSRNSVPLDEYEANVKKLVDAFLRVGAKVVLMTIPPCYDELLFSRHKPEFFAERKPVDRIADVNGVVQRIGKMEGVTVVDIYTLIEEKGGAGPEETSLIRNLANSRSKDGVHPTVEGYNLIADAVFHKLQQLDWHKAKTIVCFGDSITYGASMKGAGTAEDGADTYPAKLAKLLK